MYNNISLSKIGKMVMVLRTYSDGTNKVLSLKLN